uniref:Uncharacterized protein n=1 Tax=Manihot esculenta TaxID=3983 RepID=A0A2C9V0Z4_MANES
MVGVSVLHLDDAKHQAIIQAIDCLKALYDFELEDYNFRNMIIYRNAYVQCLEQMNGRVYIEENELQALR